MQLAEFFDYKNQLMEDLLTNEKIVKLLDDELPIEDAAHLAYTQVFPCEYVPETVQEGKTFICFDVDVQRVANKTFLSPTLYIWVFTHRSKLRLPEGGVLQSALTPGPLREDSAFGDRCREAQEEKNRYLEDWEPARKRAFLELFRGAEALLDTGGEPVAMSGRYRQTAEGLDFDAIYRARRINLLHLKQRLELLAASGRLRFPGDSPENSALYLPILLEDRDRVQRAMAEEKIYCPVIWPEPEAAAGVCPVSHAVTKHMLALPVDQRYGEKEMDFFAATLERILE